MFRKPLTILEPSQDPKTMSHIIIIIIIIIIMAKYLFQSSTSENGKIRESATMTGILPACRQSLSVI